MFTADALIFPGDLPIYEDITSSIASIKRLQQQNNIENLLSSWESPVQGQETINRRMEESVAYLNRIHTAVINNSTKGQNENPMELCQKVIIELGLPPFAATPLVARAFASSLVAEEKQTVQKEGN